MIRLKYHSLLKQKDFKNFNLIPYISLFWDEYLLAVNLGVTNHCIQLSLNKSIFFMEKTETKSKSQSFWENFFSKFMVLAFGFFWAFVLMRAFNIWFMAGLPWGTVFAPLVAFLIGSLAYIVILYAYVKLFKLIKNKPAKNSEKRNGTEIVNRSEKIAKIIIGIISLIIALAWIIS